MSICSGCRTIHMASTQQHWMAFSWVSIMAGDALFILFVLGYFPPQTNPKSHSRECPGSFCSLVERAAKAFHCTAFRHYWLLKAGVSHFNCHGLTVVAITQRNGHLLIWPSCGTCSVHVAVFGFPQVAALIKGSFTRVVSIIIYGKDGWKRRLWVNLGHAGGGVMLIWRKFLMHPLKKTYHQCAYH